jgi:LmbE family N-acetylglucosaminyl deacetylase
VISCSTPVPAHRHHDEPGSGPRTATGSRSGDHAGGGVLNVVAHPDDDLLFLSPALLVSLSSGAPVHTVFLTAGDDGRAEMYWHQRERGSARHTR